MQNDVITLIKTTNTDDSAGYKKKESTTREIFAELKSIRQSEFYQAQASGLKPEVMFEIEDYLDYDGEKELIYEDIKYLVLRTFRKGKKLEITCYGGVNIGNSETSSKN